MRINNGRAPANSKGIKINRQKKANQQRIARIAYNTNEWVYPSGPAGKSKSKDSYEKVNGFAHEEWLFDFSKKIEGYQYGFLDPIRKNHEKYVGEVFDIYLYTVNSITNEKFWVGKINNVEVLEPEECEKIKSIYIKKGWYKEMIEDIEGLHLSTRKFDRYKGLHLFNIRFREEDFEKYPDKILIPKKDPSITSFHYVLLHVKDKLQIDSQGDGKFILGNCNTPGNTKGNIKKQFQERLVEYPALHNKICEGLDAALKNEYDKVFREHQTGNKTSIDLVATKGNEVHFFEVKTFNDPRLCIRHALGQLLEYSLFPTKNLADKLFIVTQHELHDKKLLNYINHLSNTLGLNLGYICYDIAGKRIKQRI